jgi:hypothetical protein
MPHIQKASTPIPGLELIIPQVFANLILGFIVGITLMRKKMSNHSLLWKIFGEVYYWDF